MAENPLQRLYEALDDDDRKQVIELTDEVVESFEISRSYETSYRTLAQHLYSRSEADSNITKAGRQYVNTVVEVEQHRGQVAEAVISYLSGDLSSNEIIEVISSAIDAETELANRTEEVMASKEKASLPPVLSVIDPDAYEIPRGQQFTNQLTITNYGTKPAEEISLTLESDFDFDYDPETIDHLGPDEEVSWTIVGQPVDSGMSVVRATAAVNETRYTDHEFRILIREKREYVAQAVQQTQALYNAVSEIYEKYENDPPAGLPSENRGHRGLNGAMNRLEAIERRLKDILDSLDGDEANEKLESVANTGDALINHVSALSGQQIDPADGALIIRDTDYLITTVEDAINAK